MHMIILTGIFVMEQSINYLKEILQSLNLATDVEDGSESEENAVALRKSPPKKPWYRKSRKSIVRMMGSSIFHHPGERKRRRFRNRSLVRMIASSLPMQPAKRAYFEIFAGSKRMMSRAKGFLEDNVTMLRSQMPELGLADLDLFTWDGFEEDKSEVKSGIIMRGTLDNSGISEISNVSSDEAIVPPRCLKKGRKLREKETSVKKIEALEDELANLRAQIAMIVSHQAPAASIAPPCPPPPMVPTTPSAPPPPPPPVVPKLLPKINKPKNLMKTKAKENGVPSMADVLAGLSAVKLKSANLQRSPGGTPLKTRSLNQQTSSQDPADVIANALRKKFAKARKSIGSPCQDKENQWSPHADFTPSPLKSGDVSYLSPVASSPDAVQKSRRRSNTVPGKRIFLSPVQEN